MAIQIFEHGSLNKILKFIFKCYLQQKNQGNKIILTLSWYGGFQVTQLVSFGQWWPSPIIIKVGI